MWLVRVRIEGCGVAGAPGGVGDAVVASVSLLPRVASLRRVLLPVVLSALFIVPFSWSQLYLLAAWATFCESNNDVKLVLQSCVITLNDAIQNPNNPVLRGLLIELLGKPLAESTDLSVYINVTFLVLFGTLPACLPQILCSL